MSISIHANKASGRGVCKKCKKQIEKGDIQIVAEDYYAHSSVRVHLSCLMKEAGVEQDERR